MGSPRRRDGANWGRHCQGPEKQYHSTFSTLALQTLSSASDGKTQPKAAKKPILREAGPAARLNRAEQTAGRMPLKANRPGKGKHLARKNVTEHFFERVTQWSFFCFLILKKHSGNFLENRTCAYEMGDSYMGKALQEIAWYTAQHLCTCVDKEVS